MQYLGDFALGKTFDVKFTTAAASTGAPTTLAGTPVVSAYPDNGTTELTAGITLTVDFDARTGLHNVRVVATSGNGYATGVNYALVLTAGTVGGTSVVGYVIGHFSIEARSALRPTTADRTLDVSATGEGDANVVQWLGTAAATPTVAGVPEVDVTHWSGTANASPDTAGYPKVTVKSGTGAGEVSLASGVAAANSTQINGNASAASKLATMADTMLTGTVDTAGFTATSGQFETSSITEATADHFKDRIVIFTSGALLRQVALIQAYSLVGGRGHFTVTTMTDAPANTDAFIIV